MKNSYKIILVTFIILQSFACSDLLDLKPISTISSISFWIQGDDADGIVNGMYHLLREEAQNNSLLYWGEGRSETMDWSFGTGPNIYFENILDANQAGAGWSNLYNIIHHANLLIKYVPELEYDDETVRNNQLGQAYAMRAYVYYLIVRIWGETILHTEPIESFDAEAIQKERSSVNETFDLIKSDIENSLQYFQSEDLHDGRHKWSKPAVYTLKADVYNWT